MTLSTEKARLLDTIVEALSRVSNIDAVALGGSHARGTHGPSSDLDIGLYYREATPFRIDEIRRIAQNLSATRPATVAEFYDWGPFVNGGAWIDNPVSKVDFLYRNLDQLERTIAAAQRGEWQHSFDQHPPFGFRSVTTLGELHCCKPLYDPNGLLQPLKEAVAVFPPALKARIVQDTLWGAEFSFVFARNFATAGDVPNTVACLTRIYHYLVQALFALNGVYVMNDKRVLAEIETFARKPADFGARMSAVLAAPGADQASLNRSVDALRAIFAETTKIAGNSYRPKFEMP